jgi:hypothetical protein
MINFNVSLRNPRSRRWKMLWCRAYNTPLKNKHVELELFAENTIVSLAFDWTVQRDHAGMTIELGLLGYSISLNIYDQRHWDYKTNTWAKHD